jgi:hypothetical protein
VVCYPDEPSYAPEKCDELLKTWHLSSTHLGDPLGINYPYWADNPCPPIFSNGTSIGGDVKAGERGCQRGKYPEYVVNATTEDDIFKALSWAERKKIRLNVKSTGHSFQGRQVPRLAVHYHISWTCC